MSDARLALLRQHLDVAVVRLFRPAMNILIKPQVLVPIKWLRMLFFKRFDIGSLDADFVVNNDGVEFVESLRIVVLRNAGIDSVVQVVDAAIEIVSLDQSITHQRRAMVATTIEHRNLIVVPDNNQIDLSRKSISRLAILQLAKRCNLDGFTHVSNPLVE